MNAHSPCERIKRIPKPRYPNLSKLRGIALGFKTESLRIEDS